jgi:hypothetical protein
MLSDKTLTILHASAAMAHLVQAGYGWTLANTIYKDKGEAVLTNPITTFENGEVTHRNDIIGKYQLTQIVPIFSLLSTVNHAWAVFDKKRYFNYVEKGYNPTRWMEFSLSAGIMTWIIAQLSGISDIKLLSTLAISNVALQMVGLGVEKEVSRCNNADDSFHSAMLQEIIGFIIFIAIMSPIWTSFFSSIEKSEENPPDFVYTIIFIITTLYLTFGLLSIAYVRGCKNGSSSFWKLRENNFRKVELGYIILSLVSKSLLLNLTLFGTGRM